MIPQLHSLLSRNWIIVFALAFLVIAPRSSNASVMEFSLILEEEDVVVQAEGGLSQVHISAKGYELLQDAGYPVLPFRIVNVLLPQGESVASYQVVTGGRSVISKGFQPMRAAAPVSEDGVVGEGEALAGSWSGAGIFPLELGKHIGTGHLHGCAIASFAVFPLQVEDGRLILNGEITLRVTTEPSPEAAGVVERLRWREGFAEERRDLVSSMVINPGELERYVFNEVVVEKPRGGFQPTAAPSLEGSPVDYVIIVPDSFVSDYQRLADWKTAKGVPTVIRTVEWIEANYRNGVDILETIRFFLQDAYSKWGIKWALLGGDTPQIPARYGYSTYYLGGREMPADLYFACLDGSWNANHNDLWGELPSDEPDLYAEIYVGRLPSSSVTEANVMIDKIINYETPFERDYMDRFMFLAEVLFPVPWDESKPIDQNGADMTEYIYYASLVDEPLDVTRMYETYYLYSGAVPENREAALDSMESGLNHICHIGHGHRVNISVGEGSILASDALALNNPDRFFNLYMLTCTASAFDFHSCLAEAFLENPDGGAASCIGSAESAFPNAAVYYTNEYYELLFDEDFVHIGEAFARSRLPRTPYAEAIDNVDLWTHYIYTLLGEPEMVLWTGPVDTLEVFHVSNVGLGSSEILVNITAGGLPVDSAVVCLSKGIDDYQYAPTNTLGNATINFTSESPGSISVVVTGRNVARHQSYIVVDASVEAYVNLSGVSVDDDSTGASYGNGDGVIDAGETVSFAIELVNTGEAATDSVWCVLRSEDSLVSIEDSVSAVGVIGSGNTKAALDSVRVRFSELATDEAAVEFTLGIYDASAGEWGDGFVRLVHAPRLELMTLRVDDSPPLGDGNGRNGPNEEFELFYKIKNYGTGAAYGLTAELADLDGAFTFFDSTDSYADLSAMSEGENGEGFHILETSTAVEHGLEVTITDLYGRVYCDTIELREPSAPADLGFDVSLGVDRIEVSWTQSGSSDVHRYQVYHSLTSGGPYELRSVDPVDHAVYLDVGLEGNTRYYYVVTAVDSSGNESDFSAEGFASTNPPQVEGWPIEMQVETVCSPAVGDIDGDGDMEVVAGNNYVYAWHHDGIEMVDGDGNPQTWGVLNTFGLDYVAPITLSNLDDTLGLEIIAVAYSTKEVYCFDYEGDTLAGWPRATENNTRAAAVIGDIDGDDDPEIIVVDQHGVIYAWHADGTEYRDGDGDPGTQGVFYRTSWPGGWHYQTPALCDIDDDDMDEIIVGTLGDTVYVLNEDGTNVPGWPVGTLWDVAGSIAVGDIDDDGYFELVIPTKSNRVDARNHDGSALWTRWIPHNVAFAPSPALADFDGDGKLETVIASSNKSIYVITYTGADFGSWPHPYSDNFNTESSPVVADIDGDGSLDIILADESKLVNAWDVDGNLLDGFPISTGDFVRATPTVADVDLDHDVDLVVAGWDKRVYVWDLEGFLSPMKLPWPTFHANVHRDGEYGAIVPTGIGEAMVTLAVVGGSVEVVWSLGVLDGHRYDVLRGDAVGAVPSGFVRVASGLTTDSEGIIRVVDGDVEVGRRYVYRLERSDDPAQWMQSGSVYIPITKAGLLQNYPNPFNPTTRITYDVPEGRSQMVSLVVYDVTGARVKTLVAGVRRPGRYVEVWDGRNDDGTLVGSGIYFYQLRQEGFVDTKKMLLLK